MAILNLDQDRLTIQGVNNQLLPKEGPKAIPLYFDFTAADTYLVDLQLIQARAFSMLQTIFVDQSMTDQAITIVVGNLQTVVVKGRTQAYVPVLCNNPVQLKFTCPGGPFNGRAVLLNHAVPGVVWPTL